MGRPESGGDWERRQLDSSGDEHAGMIQADIIFARARWQRLVLTETRSGTANSWAHGCVCSQQDLVHTHRYLRQKSYMYALFS
jgi:hypothetical protein